MPVPRSKLSPPPAPTELIDREEAWFEQAMRRRLTVVVADAGYGKSTLLGTWAQRAPSGWYTAGPTDTSAVRLADGLAEALGAELRADEASADALAAQLVEAVEEALERDTLLVLDDAHELASNGAPMQLVQALVQQLPPRLHLAIGSRSQLPFSIERLRGQGQVGEVDAADLRFTSAEIRTLVAASLGEEVDALAAAITELTEGWPAATRLAVESLRRLPPNARHEALSRAGRPGGSLFAYLTDEVLRNEPPEVRALLEHVAPLEAFTLELCAELGFPNAPGDLDRLARGGLFLDAHGGSGGWLRLHALVREAVLAGSDEEAVRDVRVRAARWLEACGLAEDALRAWTALGDAVAVKRLLSTDALLLSGAYTAIVDAARVVPHDLADARMEEVVGDAFHCLGDDAAARAWLKRAAARGSTPGLRFRLGLLYPDRPRQALAAWDPDSLVAGERYTAAILTYAALAATTTGDPERGRIYAERALADDEGSSSAGEALHALGHAVFELGRTAEAEALYREALRINEVGNASVPAAHAMLRLAVCALHQGRYDEASSLVDLAARRSRLLIHVLWEQMLRAERSFRLGRLDEALAELESGRAAYARLGYLMEAWPLAWIGHIHRERGALALARSAYERAIGLAEEAGAPYILAPALAGLARVTAFDDPDAAAELAARAVAPGSVHSRHADALLGSGWVALATGRVEDANRFAKEAEVEARRRGQVAELAEAVELAGVATRSAPRLREALDLWRRLDAQLGAARTELALAELTGSSGDRALAVGRLRTLGVQPDAAGLAAGTYAAFARSEATVSVTTLGGFRVLREGRPVPTSEWQSRKARELLKILLCQRGRPLTRDAVMELLWPDQDPAPLAKRLSVLLATVRGVLDPHKSLPPDHYLPAKGGSIAVDLDHVELDVDRFLRLADAGAYADAEPLYTGELLPEDVYEDWSTALRDEARLAYVAVARRLAAEADDADTAVRLWQRILVQDPHDEGAHLALVRCLRAAGRHGEARRRYVAYAARMAELGIEPEVFPER